jgi:HlyD family secretion protein
MRRALSLVLAGATLAACGKSSGVIEGTGTLEVTEIDVSPLTPARVVRVWRREGDSVHAGDTLVSLTQSTARAEIDAARAGLAAAQAQQRELTAGALPTELERAEAELQTTQAEAVRSERDAERLASLVQSGGVSRQQYDAARAAATKAAAARDAAREALRLLRQRTQPERIAAARADVQNARAALEAAQRTANDLVLTTPVSGTVMLRNAEPGEVIGAGVPVMTIGELASPYVRIYVNQRALPAVRLGARAEGVLDGMPNQPFVGEVIAINSKAEFTPRVALTEEERADLLFGVKVAFRDTSGALKPGLPITVRIRTTTSASR